MKDTADLLKEVDLNLMTFGEDWPEQMSAFGNLMSATKTAGALDGKTKALVALAVSITAHCEWCIAVYVRNALAEGATREDIFEASWVAVLMGGGPALMFMQVVQKALEDLENLSA